MIESFVDTLKHSPQSNNVFNPWYDVDEINDIGPEAPEIRRAQLKQYLLERVGTAKYILLAEAIGYQGGHFTGMAMTSERILLGGKENLGIRPDHVFTGIEAKRTSRDSIKPNGFSENTATIVWGKIISLGHDPNEFILWNSFPWHPYRPDKGYLSNRTPDKKELVRGVEILDSLLNITGITNILAIGNKAHDQLARLGIKTTKARHPAYGGATEFGNNLESWLKVCNN